MDLKQATPQTLLAGSFAGGNPISKFPAVTAGLDFLLLGMDAFPGLQPNNADFFVNMVSSGPSGTVTPLWNFQQSQNFPGPFYWRGLIRIPGGSYTVTVGGSSVFSFHLWGMSLPAFTVDSLMQ